MMFSTNAETRNLSFMDSKFALSYKLEHFKCDDVSTSGGVMVSKQV